MNAINPNADETSRQLFSDEQQAIAAVFKVMTYIESITICAGCPDQAQCTSGQKLCEWRSADGSASMG